MNIRHKMALIVITSILAVALPGTALIYEFVQQNHLLSEIVTLEKVTQRFTQNATQRFLQSKPKLETLAQLLEKELKKPIQKQELVEFYKIIERNADGVWRNKKTEFNGKLEAGVFLPTNPNESDLQKIRHLRIKKVLDTFGAAANKSLENVWYLSPQRSEIIFDKNLPDFAFEQKFDNDYTQTPWFTYATPTDNPNRELRFTPPLFDPVPKLWMVSAVYPLYVDNEFIGSLGEDMPLTGTLEFMFASEQLYPNTQHFLIDTQGNFVLAGAWQKQLEALSENTKLNFGNNEQALLNLFKLKPTNKPQLLVDNLMIDKKRFAAIGMTLEPLNWHYYKLVPINEIIEPTLELFGALTGMILFISGLSGFLIFVATGQSITKRIKILTDVINRYANDHSYRLNNQLSGCDEIAQAGISFDKMANEIEQNIIERIAAEKTLKDNEELLRFALEGSGDGVWDWNLETNEVAFSEHWKIMLGYEKEELKNHFSSFDELLHEDDKARVISTVQAYFKNEIENYVIEFRLRCKDGSYKWILARATITNRNKNGEPLRMVGTHTDISKSKELEARLRTLKEAAEAATKAKSTFLANMSHEFRTPMNAIMGLSQLVLNKDISPEIRNYLEKIKTSSDSLLAVLNDILDFSKIEAGRIILEAHHFSLINLINNLDNLFALQASNKELEFKIELSSDVPVQLIGDSSHLQQVLSNLLSNAIKFTKEGRVFLNVELIKIELLNTTLKFTVSDTGIGISKEDLGKLFVPFSQADSSITRRFGGTGLGLVISRDLLQLMDSKLQIISEPDKGTTISFELSLVIDSEFNAIENVNMDNDFSFESENKIRVFENLEILEQKLAELDNLLAEDNFISTKLLEEIRYYLSDDEIIKFNKIQKFITNIEYEKARHLLKLLINVSDEND